MTCPGIQAERNIPTGTQRAGIIIINDKQQILLIRREKVIQNIKMTFYCIPGGHVEPGESTKQAALRELEEETTLHNIQLENSPIFTLINQNRQETYFVAQSWSGTPNLAGEEAERNKPENSYKLEWVDWQALPGIQLYPNELWKQLLGADLLQ